ncbi:hypothetical protein [Bordetella genomosp. 12]|nr:hypothetical protein [Bordetella genomosp. 12]
MLKRSAPMTRKTPLRATWHWGYTRGEPVRAQKMAANDEKMKEAA